MRLMLRKLSNFEAAKLTFFLFVVIGTCAAFALTPTLWPSALISVLLFFVFSPTIDSLERKGVARSHGIVGVFLICGLAITLTATYVTPLLSAEMENIQKDSSRYAEQFKERLKDQEKRLLIDYPMFRHASLADKAIQWIGASAEKFWNIAPNFASHLLMCLFLVPFLTFILLNDAHEIRRSLLRLVPNRYFETVYSLSSRILVEMGGYVSARLIEALLVGSLVAVGCLILGIPYAFILGFFAGATNAIPYLGPLLGAIPGVFLAILEPSINNQLVWVCMVYFAANLIDMLVIFPLVVAKIVAMHPAVVIISVLLGSQVFGIVGMIIAVPIASILKILFQELYTRVYNHTEALR